MKIKLLRLIELTTLTSRVIFILIFSFPRLQMRAGEKTCLMEAVEWVALVLVAVEVLIPVMGVFMVLAGLTGLEALILGLVLLVGQIQVHQVGLVIPVLVNQVVVQVQGGSTIPALAILVVPETPAQDAPAISGTLVVPALAVLVVSETLVRSCR